MGNGDQLMFAVKKTPVEITFLHPVHDGATDGASDGAADGGAGASPSALFHDVVLGKKKVAPDVLYTIIRDAPLRQYLKDYPSAWKLFNSHSRTVHGGTTPMGASGNMTAASMGCIPRGFGSGW